MKIASIVGARPQFIKLGPLSKKIREKHQEIIIHTGQHYDINMSGQFFDDLQIAQPDFNLEIGSGDHALQTGQMIIELGKVLNKIMPDMVVVFGDTNSTIAGALVSTKMQIPIAHVEAGLRSFNKEMPEEINRILTDHCSDLLFAPTETAMNNLKNEGLISKSYLTGDIMVDALMINKERALKKSNILDVLGLFEKDYLLFTLHRPYNVDSKENLKRIIAELSKIEKPIVFPVHPRTKKMIKSIDVKVGNNFKIIDPVGYLDFIMLEQASKKILTDSGGIQKEAYMLKIPCITLRPETEWVETVETGWNKLVGFDSSLLIEAVKSFSPNGEQEKIFGEFGCAEKVLEIIEDFM